MKELGVPGPIMFSMSYVTLTAIIFQQSHVVKNHSGKEARLPTHLQEEKNRECAHNSAWIPVCECSIGRFSSAMRGRILQIEQTRFGVKASQPTDWFAGFLDRMWQSIAAPAQ